MKRCKIGLIGGGQIGATIGLMSGMKELGDVVIYDIVKDMPQGKALDMSHCFTVEDSHTRVRGTNDYADLKSSDVVVVTAGLPRKEGMSRDDLLSKNAAIIKTVAQAIKQYCPGAFVICITNPLDAMVQLLQTESGLPKNMVCGMAGVLDTARLRCFLADKLNVSASDVQAMVMGGHGDTMVPLTRYCSVSGIPLEDYIRMGMISQAEVDAIIERTRHAGGEIVKLLQTGSAYNAPASAAVAMAKAYLRDERRIMPCAAHLNGEFGVSGLFVGVPCIIGGKGIEKVLEVQLQPKEREMFDKSVAAVKELCGALKLI